MKIITRRSWYVTIGYRFSDLYFRDLYFKEVVYKFGFPIKTIWYKRFAKRERRVPYLPVKPTYAEIQESFRGRFDGYNNFFKIIHGEPYQLRERYSDVNYYKGIDPYNPNRLKGFISDREIYS